jgi:hypothetical protein
MSERPAIMCVRRGDFLQPLTPLDSELIRAHPAGKPLKLQITQARRSGRQMRLYRAFLTLVADNLEGDVTPDALHEWMKLRLGLVEAVPLRSGRVDLVPKSVAFDKMEHGEFTAFFAGVKRLVLEQLIPRANCEAFEREALAMIGEGEFA